MLYLIEATIEEGCPKYTFLVKARNEAEADRKAMKIIDKNYGHQPIVLDSYSEQLWMIEIKNLKDLEKCLLNK